MVELIIVCAIVIFIFIENKMANQKSALDKFIDDYNRENNKKFRRWCEDNGYSQETNFYNWYDVESVFFYKTSDGNKYLVQLKKWDSVEKLDEYSHFIKNKKMGLIISSNEKYVYGKENAPDIIIDPL